MRILWITNTCLPFMADMLNLKLSVFEGWNILPAKLLSQRQDVAFAVASPVGIKMEGYGKISGNGVIGYYFSGSTISEQSEMCKIWKQIYADFKPDIVHVQGTEMPHGRLYVEANGSHNVVASIQGLTSVYERYFYAGIDFMDMVRKYSLYDLIRSTSIFAGRKRMKRSGENEEAFFKKLENVIGRTIWDKVHTWAINKELNYYFCNETLRPSFYSARKWNVEECDKHTIFLSQCKYPIKALHVILKAMPLVLRQFPDTKLRIGSCIRIIPKNLLERLCPTNYGGYLLNIIKSYHLEDKIDFLGNLDESEMVEQYLRCNVFVSPSSIENSPNSLGEAQLLGVPTISSMVGGVEDLTRFGTTTFCYRFEEYEMLAYYICKIFEGDYDINRFTLAMQDAEIRHSPEKNINNLLNIYKEIINK